MPVTKPMYAIKWGPGVKACPFWWVAYITSSSNPSSNQNGNKNQTKEEITNKKNKVLSKILFYFNQQNILLTLPSLPWTQLTSSEQYFGTCSTYLYSLLLTVTPMVDKTDSKKYGTARSWTQESSLPILTPQFRKNLDGEVISTSLHNACSRAGIWNQVSQHWAQHLCHHSKSWLPRLCQ